MLARPHGQTEVWTSTHELLASVVEVVSVGVAERALKKPINVTRPTRKVTGEERRAARKADSVPIGDAVADMAAQGRVRRAPRAPAGAAP